MIYPNTTTDLRNICTPRLISPSNETLYASDIDVDGSMLIVGSDRADVADRVVLVRPDGSRANVAAIETAGVRTITHASIDHGAVTWTVFDKSNATFVVTVRWADGRVEQLLEHVAPFGRDFTVFGASLICGDRVVVAKPAGRAWTLSAVDTGGATVELGTLRSPVLTRDPAAEANGRRIVTVALALADIYSTQDTAFVDLDAWPPTVSVVRRGAMPGATTAGGQLVGFWPREHTLELPNSMAVRFKESHIVVDPICTGQWAVFALHSAEAPKGTVPRSAAAMHVPTGAAYALAPTVRGRVLVRGLTVAWQSVSPSMPDIRIEPTDVEVWAATLPAAPPPFASV